MLNVIAANPRGNGYLSIYPCSSSRPEVSSLNYTAPAEATNLVAVELAADRSICIYAFAATDVIVDVFGVMAAPAGSLAERISFDKTVLPEFTPTGPDYAVVLQRRDRRRCRCNSICCPARARRSTVRRCRRGPITRQVATDQLLTLVLTRGARREDVLLPLPAGGLPDARRRTPRQPVTRLVPDDVRGCRQRPAAAFSVIFDNRGAPVWYKRTPVPMLDFKRLSNGTMVYVPQLGQAFGVDPLRGYLNTTLSGALSPSVSPNGEIRTVNPAQFPTDQHDYVELREGPSAGGRAMLSYPLIENRRLRPLNTTVDRWRAPRSPRARVRSRPTDRIVDGVIQEIDAAATLDVGLARDASRSRTRCRRSRTGSRTSRCYNTPPQAGVVDLHHLNALQRIEDGSGDYLVTARHLDAAFRVDRATKDVEWYIGGAAPSVHVGRRHRMPTLDSRRSVRRTVATARRPDQRQHRDDDGQPGGHQPAVPGGGVPV